MSKRTTSKIGFGTHAKLTWQQVPESYLDWIIANLDKPDIQEVAREAKAERSSGAVRHEADLEAQADAFLKAHGINPKSYHTPTKYQPRRR